MNSFTTIEKYAIIKVLSHIMKADGVIHPKEEDFMNKVFSELGIKICDIEDIVNIDEIQAECIIRKMTEEQKQYANSLFVSMAESDGYLHPKELSVIEKVINK
jgi:uncharacterized tellurite resistance protein B-like protein